MTGLALLVAERADRPGVQPGQPPVRRLVPQPACGEHPPHVPVRHQRDVTVAQQQPGAAEQPVRPDADPIRSRGTSALRAAGAIGARDRAGNW